MLRATIVCADGDSVFEAWNRCASGFHIGRLKNSFGTTKHQPPNMLLNVHFTPPGCIPMVGEIQIHLHGVFELKAHNHRYYELRRAPTIDAVLTENQELLADLKNRARAGEPLTIEGDDVEVGREGSLMTTYDNPMHPDAAGAARRGSRRKSSPIVGRGEVAQGSSGDAGSGDVELVTAPNGRVYIV